MTRSSRRVPWVHVALAGFASCYSPNEPLPEGADTTAAATAGPETVGEVDASGDTFSTATTGPEDESSGTSAGLSTGSADDSTTEAPGVCGDGSVDPSEVCDDGVNDGAYGGCEPGCAGLGPHCGDRVLQAREVCDDGNAVNADGCNANCIESGTELWTQTFEGDQGAIANAVNVGPQDAIAVTGTEISGGLERAWIRRYDADGIEDWTQSYAEAGSTRGLGIAVDGDGGIVACGDDGWSRKYDLGSALVYANEYEVAVGGVTAVDVDEDGYSVVVGERNTSPENGGDIWVRRLGPDGDEFWTETFHGGTNDAATGVALGSGENVVVAGYEDTGSTNVWLRKYTSEGAPVWTRGYDGGSVDLAFAVATGPDEVVAVAGRARLLGSDAVWLRLYDGAGTEIWTETFESGFAASVDTAYGVAVDGEGNVVVVGEVQSADPDVTRAWVRKYSPAGAQWWTREWNIVEPTSEAETSARGVAIDSELNVVIVGFEADSDGAYSAWVRKLAP